MSTPKLVLDAAVALSEQRDLPTLNAAFVDELRRITSARAVRLLEVIAADGGADRGAGGLWVRDLTADGAGPRPLADDPDLAACVDARACVVRDVLAGQERLILPVPGIPHVRALVVIEGSAGLAADGKAIEPLVRLYGNQAYLLGRSELDPLTGLYNRQSFDERLQAVVRRLAWMARRGGDAGERRHSCFALIDLDHFKQVNDRFGHLYGDEVLLLLSRLMRQSFRHNDMLFRYGGEEFAVVLADVDVAMAVRALERFRQTVAAYAFPQVGRKTVSIGLTELGLADATPMPVERADRALYYAKNQGRNRVGCYETLVAEGRIAAVAAPAGRAELF